MKKHIALITTILTLSACASQFNSTSTVQAEVLGVEPVPELCFRKGEQNTVATLGGALIGGLIGNQFGSGSGKKLATVAGVGAGAAIANNATKDDSYLHCEPQGYEATVRYIHPSSGKQVIEKVTLKEHTYAEHILVPVQ